jgi:small subunit ribosomal protein S17
MAETPPENTEETPDSLVEEVETAASDEGAGVPTTDGAEELEQAAPAAPAAPAPGATRRDRLEQRRDVRRTAAGRRSQRTPEERAAERVEERKRKAAERRRYRAHLKARKAQQRAETPVPEAAHAPEHGPGRAKVRQGVVVSDKGDKTIIVRMDVVRRHQRYHKILRSTQTLSAHDERNDANAGDTVRVQECRPMSRTKRWRLLDVVERAR